MALGSLPYQSPTNPDFAFCHPWLDMFPFPSGPSARYCAQAYSDFAAAYIDTPTTARTFVNNRRPLPPNEHDPWSLPRHARMDGQLDDMSDSDDGDSVEKPAFGVPFGASFGEQCNLWVDVVDPERGFWLTPTGRFMSGKENRDVSATPATFMEMAGWVLRKCVQEQGQAGFVTRNLANTLRYLRDTDDEWWSEGHIWPTDALFFTAGMGHQDFVEVAGYMDPALGGTVFTSLHRELLKLPRGAEGFRRIETSAKRAGWFFGSMRRGDATNRNTWYGRRSENHRANPRNEPDYYA